MPRKAGVKAARKANYDGELEPLIPIYGALLPYVAGYTVSCEDPLDEEAFALRKAWVLTTKEKVCENLLVRYSTFFALGMHFARSGGIPVRTKRLKVRPTGREYKEAPYEFASEMQALNFHVRFQF